MFDKIYEIKRAKTVKEKKELLSKLTERELYILNHLYNNDKMIERCVVREYIDELAPKIINGINIYDIISYVEKGFDERILVKMILSYIYYLEIFIGEQNARRASKLLFREENIGLSKRFFNSIYGRGEKCLTHI